MPVECPVGSLTSFPLGLNITPTETIYGTLIDSSTPISVEWSSRTTPPSFKNTASTGGVLDEVASDTTLRYNSSTYTMTSVQICSKTHSQWILPTTSQSKNYEDIVMIFTTTAKTAIQILMIIVPILRNGKAKTDPEYLTAIGGESGDYSLRDCLAPGLYVNYISCLAGYSGAADSQNVGIFVSTKGISVSPDLMTNMIAANFTSAFPAINAPFMTAFTGSRAIGTGRDPLNKWIKTCTPFTTVTVDAMTAVTGVVAGPPPPPETNIIDPGKIERGVAILIGVIVGALFLGIGGYIVYSYITPNTGVPTTSSNLGSYAPMIGVGVVGTLIGYMIGTLT